MKKLLAILVIICCICSLVGALSACQGSDWENGNLKVVTTIFPEYDWTMSILGEHATDVNIKNLLNSGVDMHSYQSSPADMVYIATCDLLVYVGGESDGWIEDALKQATNKDMVVIKLLDVIKDSVLDEEHKDGMQGESEEEVTSDEHVWLSLKRAKLCVNAIADAIKQLDAGNADDYTANTEIYCDELDKLDAEYREATSNGANKTLIVADRFPFRYLFADYGLDYYAAFSGCSAETEASFATITFLAQKVDELQAKVIIKTESGKNDIPQTIINNSRNKNQKILTLNSLQSIGAQDRDKGVNYLSIMQSNLEVLREALA
ncbi:MAG: zinc ABC transporter substrate-binding protein [Clostridiales bacterium]|nr:zinc ABC transporter substrate-binding protein [Clostridiales bacterium]